MKLTLSADSEKATRRREIRKLKIYWSVFHQFFISNDDVEIAAAVDITVEKLLKWRKSHAANFENAKLFWHPPEYSRDSQSLKSASKLWTDFTHEGLDLFPTENAIDCFLEERGLNTLRSTAENQIGLEALTPARRFSFWIHDITTAIFAIGLLIG